MPCRSSWPSATSASGFKGSVGATLGSAALGLISLTFGPRLLCSSLALADPGGSPGLIESIVSGVTGSFFGA